MIYLQPWLLFDCLVLNDRKLKKALDNDLGIMRIQISVHPYLYDDGMEESMRIILLIQLQNRFGPLADSIKQRVQTLHEERLLELAHALLKADSLGALGLDD